MTELEKVIRGLELCSIIPSDRVHCHKCPYNNGISIGCMVNLMKDAIALLKEQVPRVMSLEEVVESENWMWIEYTSGYCEWCRQIDILKRDNSIVWNDESIDTLDDYDQRWRCWTSRPDEQVRRDTPWGS